MEIQTYRVNTPSIVSETIDGEVIIINLDAGNYYSLNNAVGVRVWTGIENGQSNDAIISALTRQYSAEPDTIQAAVTRFIADLQSENLIVPSSDANTGVTLPGDAPAGEFEMPTLQKFSDMQDLLLLDPIHEVDETGWPLLPNTAE